MCVYIYTSDFLGAILSLLSATGWQLYRSGIRADCSKPLSHKKSHVGWREPTFDMLTGTGVGQVPECPCKSLSIRGQTIIIHQEQSRISSFVGIFNFQRILLGKRCRRSEKTLCNTRSSPYPSSSLKEWILSFKGGGVQLWNY